MADPRQQNLDIGKHKQYKVTLDVYEGPLDLLLNLINKHELDIFDIPIAFVTQKYLEYLDLMQELNLDLASDYLEMAAQLTLIKSRMMLPNEAVGDDDDLEMGPDPREELVRQLLDYQKYKTAAQQLSALPQKGRDTFNHRPVTASTTERPFEPPGLFALMESLKKVYDRIGEEEDSGEREISITRVSISARIHQILDKLREVKRLPFELLFESIMHRSDVVTTFLAILEMTKLGLTRIHQAAPGTEIHITANADEEEAIRVLAENHMEQE